MFVATLTAAGTIPGVTRADPPRSVAEVATASPVTEVVEIVMVIALPPTPAVLAINRIAWPGGVGLGTTWAVTKVVAVFRLIERTTAARALAKLVTGTT